MSSLSQPPFWQSRLRVDHKTLYKLIFGCFSLEGQYLLMTPGIVTSTIHTESTEAHFLLQNTGSQDDGLRFFIYKNPYVYKYPWNIGK